MIEGEIEQKSEAIDVRILEAFTGDSGGKGRKELNIM